mgnify:FL=1
MNKQFRGYAITTFAAICWGFSGVCGELLVKRYAVDPEWLTSVRMILAGGLLIAFILGRDKGLSAKHRQLLRTRADWVSMLVYTVFGLIANLYTYLIAVKSSNAGTATVLQYLGPILIVIWVCIRSKRRPHLTEVFAVLLALVGTAVLATHGNIGELVITPAALYWGLACALALALYTLIPTKLIRKYSSDLVVCYGMLLGGTLMSLATMVWQVNVQTSAGFYLYMVGMVVLGTVVAFVLFLQGVQDIGAVNASLIACLEPVAASLFSFALAGTYFSGEDIAGMALIMCAVLAVGFQDFMVARHNPHPRTNELSSQPAAAESPTSASDDAGAGSAGAGSDGAESAGSDGAEPAASDGASPADTVGAASSAAKTPVAVK